MLNTVSAPSVSSVPAAAPVWLSRVLLSCIDIQAVWSLGHDGLAREATWEDRDVLIFADRLTLQTLRKSDALHRADVQVLVVFDGDQFENAWGPQRFSGSLARWAWRPVAHDVAYYDESRWAEVEGAGRAVTRVRRKAFLIWPSPLALR